jgi:DNA-binding GntR family transcriptional regulator
VSAASYGGLAAVAYEIAPVPGPLYEQVYRLISDAIASGRFQPGDRLPTERAFSTRLGVSRATVRRALRRLIDEGVIEAAVGRGSFVRSAVLTEPPNALMSFTELAQARDLTPGTRVLRHGVRQVTPEEASVFDLDVQAQLFELERLRLLDGAPVAVDRGRIPLAVAPMLPELDLVQASIYATLEAAGAAPTKADVVVSAVTADEERAAALEIAKGDALLVCTTMTRDAKGRLVEISEIAYRADRYRFRATLTRR